MSKIHANIHEGEIWITFPYNPCDVERVKALPERRFLKSKGAWLAPATAETVQHLQEFFPDRVELCRECRVLIQGAQASAQATVETLVAKRGPVDTSEVPGALIKGKELRQNQLEALALGGRQKRFGFIMDMGTGKTLTYLADGVWAWRRGSVNLMMIFTRNNVVEQIGREVFPAHIPDDVPYAIGLIRSSRTSPERRRWENFVDSLMNRRDEKLHILIGNWECLDRMWDWLVEVADKRTIIYADESTAIKQPPKFHKQRGPQNRSAKAITIRRSCLAARIGTGNPIIKKPLDAWAQLWFLDRALLPWGSWTAFKAHFAVSGGFEGRQILFYKNLDDLSAILAGCTYRCLRTDVPGKIYADPVNVDLGPEQRRVYDEMRKEALVILDKHGKLVDFDGAIEELLEGGSIPEMGAGGNTVHHAPIVLTVRMRLAQIAAGYLPVFKDGKDPRTGTPVRVLDGYKELVPPDKNPKLQAALELIEDAGDQKVVLWCVFRRELEAMAEILKKAGIGFVEYHGGTSTADRAAAKKRFIEDPETRVFLSVAQCAGTGTDGLQVASIMIFVTNTPHTEVRYQAEDRINRLGQENECTYYDIIARNTVDTKNLAIVRGDVKLSEQILGDNPEEWI